MFSVGHVVLAQKKAHILLVTLNKQGRADEHKYMDHWIDDTHFHWQSQNATDPTSKRGDEIIRHAALGINIHLFVRDAKLAWGKAAPFTYHGRVRYQSHQGKQAHEHCVWAAKRGGLTGASLALRVGVAYSVRRFPLAFMARHCPSSSPFTQRSQQKRQNVR
jgi:hypothetical protein